MIRLQLDNKNVILNISLTKWLIFFPFSHKKTILAQNQKNNRVEVLNDRMERGQ